MFSSGSVPVLSASFRSDRLASKTVANFSACDLILFFSMVILSLPLIQEGQLSVSGERMCTILVNCLED